MPHTIKSGDTAPAFGVTLLSLNQPVNLAGATVTFIMATAAGVAPVVTAAAVLEQVGDGSDGSKGKVRYDWVLADTAVPGSFVAEWEVVYASGKRQTFPSSGFDTVTINDDLGGTG